MLPDIELCESLGSNSESFRSESLVLERMPFEVAPNSDFSGEKGLSTSFEVLLETLDHQDAEMSPQRGAVALPIAAYELRQHIREVALQSPREVIYSATAFEIKLHKVERTVPEAALRLRQGIADAVNLQGFGDKGVLQSSDFQTQDSRGVETSSEIDPPRY